MFIPTNQDTDKIIAQGSLKLVLNSKIKNEVPNQSDIIFKLVLIILR